MTPYESLKRRVGDHGFFANILRSRGIQIERVIWLDNREWVELYADRDFAHVLNIVPEFLRPNVCAFIWGGYTIRRMLE